MPHNWLRENAYYEEIETDHQAKEKELKDLKRCTRLQSDKVQCQEMRKALLRCLGWGRFVEAWKSSDLILNGQQKVGNRAQALLFEKHKKDFQHTKVPLLYHPKDSRKQNIVVPIPGTQRKEELVLNDVVNVKIDAAEREIRTDDWQLGYSVTVHSSQSLTIHNPQKVWIIDDYLQWSNLAYLFAAQRAAKKLMHQVWSRDAPGLCAKRHAAIYYRLA